MSAETQVHYGSPQGDEGAPKHNSEVSWEAFDPEAYWDHNYRSLRKDDLEIVQTVAEFFSRRIAGRPDAGRLRGIDVGAGSNLYPALSMLPWANRILLTDVSSSNCAWLADAVRGPRAGGVRPDWSWTPFWHEFLLSPGYERIRDPRVALADGRVEVRQTGVMDLPEAQWDLGTMFFVAESMTSYENEFDNATAHFMRALTPGAPFAAAFMDSSVGYVVADQSFPAVGSVNRTRAKRELDRFSDDVVVKKVTVPPQDALREGYDGMIVAVGTRRAT